MYNNLIINGKIQMENTSIFDIIGPIMIGPSSSHTAGAVRLGLLSRTLYGKKPSQVEITLYNSFAQTQKGHGTDKGVIGGILGFNVDNPDIKFAKDIAKKENLKFSINSTQDPNRHPNSVDIILDNNMEIKGNSKGAGEIEIIQINDFQVNMDGNLPCLVMIYKDKPGMISAVSKLIQEEEINIATFECKRTAKGETASMVVSLDAKPSADILNKIQELADVYLIRSIEGLKK